MSEPARITYREAVRQAIREALRSDQRVFLMGEDVGKYGGCFAVSKGLLAEFGRDRLGEGRLADLATAEQGDCGKVGESASNQGLPAPQQHL